jgi:hypothetical protein
MREQGFAVLTLTWIGELAVTTPLVLTIWALTLNRSAYAAHQRAVDVVTLLRVVLIRLAVRIAELLCPAAVAADGIAVVLLSGWTTDIGAERVTGLTRNELALSLRFERHIAHASLLGFRSFSGVLIRVRRHLSLRRLTFAALVSTPVVLTLSGVLLVDQAPIVLELILGRGQPAQPQALTKGEDH